MRYKIMKEDADIEGRTYTSCSIAVMDGDECLRIIHDVFLDEQEAEEFVGLCNRLEVSVIHIDDVIQDFIGY